MSTEDSISPTKVVTPKSGVSVTSPGGDSGIFLAEVNQGLKRIVEAINHLLDISVNWLNDHIDEIGTVGGGVVGTVVLGPVGGIAGAIGGHHAAAAAEDKLAATFDQINQTWQDEVLPAFRKAIGSILGDPAKMAEIGEAYRASVRLIGGTTTAVNDSAIYEGDFNGDSAGAYAKVRDAQVPAIAGVQNAMLAAGTRMDEAQKALIDYWTQQLVNIGNLIEGLGEVTSDATDVGKIALGDAGPVINLLTTLAKGGDDILAAWIGDVAEHATTGAGFWQGQIAGLGSAGMPDGQWPRISERHLPNLNSPTWTK